MIIEGFSFMEVLPVVIVLGILGLILIVLMFKETTKYWQWMPMHSLWYKITKMRRNKKGGLKVRLYDQRADLYQCPICRHYLDIEDLTCSYCGQKLKKSFWV